MSGTQGHTASHQVRLSFIFVSLYKCFVSHVSNIVVISILFFISRSFLGKGPNLGIKNPNDATKLAAEVIQSDDEEEETDSDDDDIPEEYDEDEGNSWDQPRSQHNTPRDTHRDRDASEKQRERPPQHNQDYKRSESSASSSSKQASSSTDDLRVGSRVEARYRGGPKFYAGKVSRVRLDGTFDIEYDDGECETRIGKLLIRVLAPRGGGGGGQGAVYKRAESNPDSYETPRETPRMQRPTPLAVKQSR